MDTTIKKIDIKFNVDDNSKKKSNNPNPRVITNNKNWKYDNITHHDEIKILNDLKNDIDNEDTKILKRELKKKLSGYKNQDILKNKFNNEEFITLEETLTKIIECKTICLYCNYKSKLFYKYVRDTNQWTLDRIDNNFGHNANNVEISCLKCNLRRKTITPDKYILTQKLTNIKKI